MNNGREYNKLLLSAFFTYATTMKEDPDLATVEALQRRFEWLGNNECELIVNEFDSFPKVEEDIKRDTQDAVSRLSTNYAVSFAHTVGKSMLRIARDSPARSDRQKDLIDTFSEANVGGQVAMAAATVAYIGANFASEVFWPSSREQC